jgi:hypothetical protein
VLPPDEQAHILDLFVPVVDGWFDRSATETPVLQAS